MAIVTHFRHLPVKLQQLQRELYSEREVYELLNVLVTESSEVVQLYVSAIENEGSNILVEKSNLIRIVNPNDVDVERLHGALNDFKTAVSNALEKMKLLEAKVHIGTEKCKEKQSEHEYERKAKEAKISQLNQEITNCEQKIADCEIQASRNENEARELNRKASRMEREEKEAKKAGLVGGAVGFYASVLLVPFSGGASLIAAGATAGWVGGALFAAKENRDKAKALERCARDERANARRAQERKETLCNETSSAHDQISRLHDKIDKLKHVYTRLEEIKRCLLASIALMNNVETLVQDIDSSVHDASTHGKLFDILKKALAECPVALQGGAMTCMLGLREKWRNLENEILKTCKKI